MSYFSELGLAEPILRALEAKGYADPTPIQQQAIPALMQGRDLLGIAQTGTGKTAAFALPSLHRLAAEPVQRKPASCRMLVLSPTRELAAQIAENMRGYAKFLRLQVDCVFGGMPIGKQARRLVPGTDILVATPGRLLDLIDSRALTLGRTEIFVLDEADQMMDLGFIHALKRIANLLPAKRQSLFFSATMPKAIAELGKQFIHDPVRVEVAPQSTTAERVEQFVTFVNQAEKQALLSLRVRAMLADRTLDRGIVFTRTKHGADRVARHLGAAGIDARAIHGNKSQAQRTAALEAFRQGACPILVATDIAARGIDVSGVSHVFNFELPNVPEQYVHRIGRTARAGADGVAISFCAPDEKAYLRDIERLTGVKPDPMPLPDGFQAEAARLPKPAHQPVTEEREERRGRPARGRGDAARGDGGRGDGARGESGRGPRRDQRQGDPRRNERAGGPADGSGRGAGSRDGGGRGDAGRQDGNRARPAAQGQPRQDTARRDDARAADPARERGPLRNPASGDPGPRGDRRERGPAAGAEAPAQRRFRPRGPAGGSGNGGGNGGGNRPHRGRVQRAV